MVDDTLAAALAPGAEDVSVASRCRVASGSGQLGAGHHPQLLPGDGRVGEVLARAGGSPAAAHDPAGTAETGTGPAGRARRIRGGLRLAVAVPAVKRGELHRVPGHDLAAVCAAALLGAGLHSRHNFPGHTETHVGPRRRGGGRRLQRRWVDATRHAAMAAHIADGGERGDRRGILLLAMG